MITYYSGSGFYIKVDDSNKTITRIHNNSYPFRRIISYNDHDGYYNNFTASLNTPALWGSCSQADYETEKDIALNFLTGSI